MRIAGREYHRDAGDQVADSQAVSGHAVVGGGLRQVGGVSQTFLQGISRVGDGRANGHPRETRRGLDHRSAVGCRSTCEKAIVKSRFPTPWPANTRMHQKSDSGNMHSRLHNFPPVPPSCKIKRHQLEENLRKNLIRYQNRLAQSSATPAMKRVTWVRSFYSHPLAHPPSSLHLIPP